MLGSLNENPVMTIKNASKYQFGNYKKYYNLRYKQRWNDPRLTVMKSDYFINKNILDIGCNDGTVAL
jgi:7SK snRNA methylphosphate capping enzyme